MVHLRRNPSGKLTAVSDTEEFTAKPTQAYMEALTEDDTGLGLSCKLITRANKQNWRIGKNLLLNVEVDWHFFCISQGGRAELRSRLLATFGCWSLPCGAVRSDSSQSSLREWMLSASALSGLAEPSPSDKQGQWLGPWTLAALKTGMDLGMDEWLKIERIFVLFIKWWFSKICCGKGSHPCEPRLYQSCSHQGSINQGRDDSAWQGKHRTLLQRQGHVPRGQHTDGRQVSSLPQPASAHHSQGRQLSCTSLPYNWDKNILYWE